MLNKELKKVWCEALRSGEFEQGDGWLKRHGRYCCLGVLKEIQPGITKSYASETLSHKSLELIGLTVEDQTILTNMNDGVVYYPGYGESELRTYSFKQIANYIEKHL